ncbi:MAG: hypothetical protein HY054_03560 [Proteobacteria bacterium]|nr:hypothetical protein [Pseudomonadota bacterium]
MALIVVSVIGAAALAVLSKRGWRSVVLSERTREAALWVALAAPFAVLAIGADLLLRFPRDINVPAPWSVLFYPTMGFVVEGVFHALPLALLALPFGASLRTSWIWLAPVALIEPVFQVREAFADSRISALEGFVFLQVLAINIVELHVFRRHGFLSAWSFRLSYYLLWHVAWGHLRLL